MVEVRTIDAVDIDAWVKCMGVGFLKPVAEGFGAYELGRIDLARTWGAFDGERVVGTLRSFSTPLTVPGPAELEVTALTNVTVAATHRRQGLLTSMITGDLHDAVDRGDPLSILIAAEYGIYGRFGYGPAIDGARYSIDTDACRFTLRPPGTVEFVDEATLRTEAPPIYERYRVAQPGAIGRSAAWWDRSLHQVEVPGSEPNKGYQVLYRSPSGEPAGYVRYQAEQKWDGMRPRSVVTVDELVAVTDDAYNRLWQYCCEVDLVTTVQAGDRPVDEALVWSLADGRAIHQTGRYDFVWMRVLDVCGALSRRVYGTEGRVVIEVTDPMGFAAGRFVLDGGPAGATCTVTSESAQLSLPVEALGSLYMGGVSLRSLAVGGMVSEHVPGALSVVDAMFRSLATPWCSTWF
jgi:predicted acetyltransferase